MLKRDLEKRIRSLENINDVSDIEIDKLKCQCSKLQNTIEAYKIEREHLGGQIEQCKKAEDILLSTILNLKAVIVNINIEKYGNGLFTHNTEEIEQ